MELYCHFLVITSIQERPHHEGRLTRLRMDQATARMESSPSPRASLPVTSTSMENSTACDELSCKGIGYPLLRNSLYKNRRGPPMRFLSQERARLFRVC